VPAPTPAVSEAIIEYQDGLFNPAILRIKAGTKVTFKNRGAKSVWPVSGVHPAHKICPGFDALRALDKGESYSFVFTEVKDCPFHNHIAPTEKGKIEVKAGE